MNITEITGNFNSLLKSLLERDDLYMLLLLVLVGVAAFGLGRASIETAVSHTAPQEVANLEASRASGAQQEAEITKQAPPSETAVSGTLSPASGKYVASKSGSKYHLPWCGGAKQIKEENKVWFETKEEAEAAGYLPAANCKGI